MASTRSYRWKSGDQIWYVCSQLLAESGYESVSSFVEAVRTANAAVLDWASVPVGTLVSIPYVTS